MPGPRTDFRQAAWRTHQKSTPAALVPGAHLLDGRRRVCRQLADVLVAALAARALGAMQPVVKRMARDIGEWWLTSDNRDQRKYHRKLCRGNACLIVGRVVRKESDRI